MKRPLVLIGGGGHCKSVIEAAESAGYSIRGVLDLPENIGRPVLDTTVIGSDADIAAYVADCDFIVTVGFIKDPTLRVELHRRVETAGGRLATVIASTARVSRHAQVGDGTVILHGAVVNAGARVGKGCIINTLADIEHDARVGDYCHISTGAIVNGDCQVGEASFLGSGSVLANGVTIPAGTIIAAGAVIPNTLPAPGLYAGVPAKRK